VIVENEEDDGNSDAVISGNLIGELGLRCPIHGFQNHTVAVGPITRKATHHTSAAQIPQPHGRPGRNRHAASDNGIRAEVAHGEVRDVYAASTTAAVSVLLAEKLRDRATDMFLDGFFK